MQKLSYLVLRPRPDWCFVPDLMDIRKASLLYQRGGLIRDSESLARHVSRFDECPAPLGHGVVFTYSAIVTRERDVHFQVLYPCPRRHVVVRLSVQRGPIADATHEATNVHKVEVVS